MAAADSIAGFDKTTVGSYDNRPGFLISIETGRGAESLAGALTGPAG